MANNKALMVMVLLSIFIARSRTTGEQASASDQNQDAVIEKLTVFKEQIFVAGADVALWCEDNVTEAKWSEFIFIVWNISRQGRKCWLGLSPNPGGNCTDRKHLVNTTDGVYLSIPKISKEDEGFYSCDLSFKGGSNIVNVSVRVTDLETQLDNENGQMIAVCKATYKETAPTLHWEPALNFSFSNTSVNKVDKYFIMENRVHLDDDVLISDLSCVASYASVSGSVRQKSTLYLKEKEAKKLPWDIIAISCGSVCCIFVSLAVVYLLRKKLKHISGLKMLCCKSKISPPAEDKPPQPNDVEEVEPYASYIQRVNSIYNSSAELFNA